MVQNWQFQPWRYDTTDAMISLSSALEEIIQAPLQFCAMNCHSERRSTPPVMFRKGISSVIRKNTVKCVGSTHRHTQQSSSINNKWGGFCTMCLCTGKWVCSLLIMINEHTIVDDPISVYLRVSFGSMFFFTNCLLRQGEYLPQKENYLSKLS